MKFFNTTHSSLDEVFGTDKTYVIPAYQRPYSWQCVGKTESNNQVNRMWNDLWEFHCNNNSDKEYFLGSMVVIEQSKTRTFEVVDGQQRLTTLALLFAAMSCFLKEHCDNAELANFKADAIARLESRLFNTTGITLQRTLKVKILRVAGFDYDQVVERVINCEKTSEVTDEIYSEIAQRYVDNRDYFTERLREYFLTDGIFDIAKAEAFNLFFTFLHVRVALVLITTTSFDTAFMIFETLNNRGLPLTNLDLLRNFLLQQLTEANVPDAPALWSAIEEKNLKEDYLGRWVESWVGKQQRSSAFNDLSQIYREDDAFQSLPNEPRATRFYKTFERDLNYYNLIDRPETVDDKAIRNKIRFLRAAGNERYSTNLMLALFRQQNFIGQSNEPVLEFLCQYQRWILNILLAPKARFSNGPIYEAITLILAGKVTEAKTCFAATQGSTKLATLIDGEIRDNNTAVLLLAEYVWQEASSTSDVVEQELSLNVTSLEHIIPQKPKARSEWVNAFNKTFREANTYRLGNMTLLTTRMNSAANNSDFDQKKAQYQKTLLPITRELANLSSIGPKYIEARQARIVAGIRKGLRL